MTRHPFRWDSLAFGAFFLAIVGNWAVWSEDLLSPRELALTASGALIFLGLLGVTATFWKSRPPRAATPAPDEDTSPNDSSTQTTPEGQDNEEAQPQP